MTPQANDEWEALVRLLQVQHILGDSKTIVDCTPRQSYEQTLSLFRAQADQLRADPEALRRFVFQHFALPKDDACTYARRLWPVLTRDDGPGPHPPSLIPLPRPYIVPGGRFRELYYWDAYFTMLGLRSSGHLRLLEDMVENFAHLIRTFGHVPNGTRTYYLSRSQPPFFSLMVKLLPEDKGRPPLLRFLPELKAEHAFWTWGDRAVALPDGSRFSRYYDGLDTPRPESYPEDVELAARTAQPEPSLFRNLRAAAESGWDFSSRWLSDPCDLGTIRTTEIVPIDLNCLLWHLESTIAQGCTLRADMDGAEAWRMRAGHRQAAIARAFWNSGTGFFCDVDLPSGQALASLTLAGMFPLYFGLATREQASTVAQTLEHRFLQPGGLVTTLVDSGQQWDWPNGWAPLHWIAIQGLRRYNFMDLATTIATRWTVLNERRFQQTGRLFEKYDVVTPLRPGGGGEYPLQDGFGWTNGVLLALTQSHLDDPAPASGELL